jgi:hypothetical protein
LVNATNVGEVGGVPLNRDDLAFDRCDGLIQLGLATTGDKNSRALPDETMAAPKPMLALPPVTAATLSSSLLFIKAFVLFLLFSLVVAVYEPLLKQIACQPFMIHCLSLSINWLRIEWTSANGRPKFWTYEFLSLPSPSLHRKGPKKGQMVASAPSRI